MSQSCDGQADIYEQRTRKARKAHECEACELPIRPGDTYTRETMLFDGRWENTVRCARCQMIFEHLVTMCRSGDGFEEEWPDSRLNCGHEYRERWGIDPPAWLAALAFWMPSDPLPEVNPCTPAIRPTECRSSPWGGPYYRCMPRALRWEDWSCRTPNACLGVAQ